MKLPTDATDEQIAAARLRAALDAKLGRETPDWMRQLAAGRPVSKTTIPADDDPAVSAPTEDPRSSRTSLMSALGVEVSADLLTRALTHRSFTYENGPANDRLELLGDAVLGLVITDRLYNDHPGSTEVDLAKLRAGLINMNALADIARGLGEGGLGKHLLLGETEEGAGGRDRANILADALEAVLGAVYAEKGLDVVRGLIDRLFEPVSEGVSKMAEETDVPR